MIITRPGFLVPTVAILVLIIMVADQGLVQPKPTKDARLDRGIKQKKLAKNSNKYLDTRDTQCGIDEYRCSNGKCIKTFAICDTHFDCSSHEDEKNCPSSCSGTHQFKCEDGSGCIGTVDVCDAYVDCMDHSDEANCAAKECPAGRHFCPTSHECISESFLCDGEKDCEDGSDETNCVKGSCGTHQFLCEDGNQCISKAYVCDGNFDCLVDHSDEKACVCPTTSFKCPNGLCINNSYKCDGVNDCGDMSDEINCPEIPATTCKDVMTYEDCFHMNTTTHPLCLIYPDAHRYCRKFCNLCS